MPLPITTLSLTFAGIILIKIKGQGQGQHNVIVIVTAILTPWFTPPQGKGMRAAFHWSTSHQVVHPSRHLPPIHIIINMSYKDFGGRHSSKMLVVNANNTNNNDINNNEGTPLVPASKEGPHHHYGFFHPKRKFYAYCILFVACLFSTCSYFMYVRFLFCCSFSFVGKYYFLFINVIFETTVMIVLEPYKTIYKQ